MASQVKIGTVTGTGASINVELGWQPDYVLVQNITATDFASVAWFLGMAAGTGIKQLTSTGSLLATLGITLYVGSTTASKGFTIGADTDLNVAAELITYVAYRNLP